MGRGKEQGPKRRGIERKNKDLSKEERRKKIKEFIKVKQEFHEMNKPEKPEVEVSILDMKPIQVLMMSDLHWGSVSTDYDSIYQQVDYIIETDGSYVIFNGDLIEGVKPAYLDTNIDSLAMNLNEQVETFRHEVISPLSEAGKIIVAEGGHKGHDEWMKELAQLSAAIALFGGYDIDIVVNGGVLFIDLPEYNFKMAVMISHNLSGSNRNKVLGGPRKAAMASAYDLDGSIAGHTDYLSAISMELSDDDKQAPQVLVQTGTTKGTDPKKRDRFAERSIPGAPAAKGEKAWTMFGREADGSPIRYITSGLDQHRIIKEGADLRFEAERQGFLDELFEELRYEAGGFPVANFHNTHSRKKVYDGDPTPHWEALTYRMDYQGSSYYLPAILFFPHRLRAGVKNSETKLFNERMKIVAADDYAYAIFSAGMVDSSLAGSGRREKDFENGLIKPARPVLEHEQIKVLASLFSAEMRKEGFKIPRIRLGRGQYQDPDGFFPGKELYERFGVNMINNQGTIYLKFPGYNFSIYLIDSASGNSPDDPFYGLVKEEAKWAAKNKKKAHDVVVGGRHTKAGVMINTNPTIGKDQIFISPSWLSYEHNIGSKGRRHRVSNQMQALIVDPYTQTLWPTATEAQSATVYEAITLRSGLMQTNDDINYWQRKLEKSHRKQHRSIDDNRDFHKNDDE